MRAGSLVSAHPKSKTSPARRFHLDIGLVLQSLLYAGSGVNHLVYPAFYLHIMPDHYTDPAALVSWSGVAEILGGVGLLVPVTRRFAAGGLCLMLVVFLDVHVSMLRHQDRFPQMNPVLLWARLPLQAVLIAWAAKYLKPAMDGTTRSDG